MLKPTYSPTLTNLRQLILSRLSRLRLVIVVIVTFVLLLSLLLPLDSPVRSFFRFHRTSLNSYIQQHYGHDDWLYRPPRYNVNSIADIGIMIKTGYGTRERVPKLLAALGKEGFDADIVVLQDYPVNKDERYNMRGGAEVPAVDIIGWMLEQHVLPATTEPERVTKYKKLVTAIEAKKLDTATELGRSNGWELDAMKFISGFQYTYHNLPRKKWYLMLDDDSYVILPTLLLILRQLDPSQSHYVGNAVGSYSGRFAHGGSSFFVSGATLTKLFDENPKVVTAAHVESTTSTWGDGLISSALMKIGVYLDETYTKLFNGEDPRTTRIWADRFCLPILSMHSLRSVEAMDEVGSTFASVKTPVQWYQLPEMFGAPKAETFLEEPARANHNFVGRLDEHSVTIEGLAGMEECFGKCLGLGEKCLAWTWEVDRELCHVAPWYVVGSHQENVHSGINMHEVGYLKDRCEKTGRLTPVLDAKTFTG